MKCQKIILQTFMNANYSNNKIFEGFDFKSFIQNKKSEESPMCSICLESCIVPSALDTCTHKFCYSCIKRWSVIKKFCPYCRTKFNRIIKYHYFPNKSLL